MFCAPRSDGWALLTGARPPGVCPHGRRLYYCIACGGKGWCREHQCWRATCVQCGPSLASALCALHPEQRRDCCPCRRRRRTAADACGAPGAVPVSTAAVVCPVIPAPAAMGCESATAGRGVRRRIRVALACVGGPSAATRSRMRACGVFQSTRSMLRRRGARPASMALAISYGAVRKEPARAMRRVARLGTRGCSNPLCPCDVDSEGYECRPLSMMTRASYVHKTLLGVKPAEWRRLSGVVASDCMLLLVCARTSAHVTDSCSSQRTGQNASFICALGAATLTCPGHADGVLSTYSVAVFLPGACHRGQRFQWAWATSLSCLVCARRLGVTSPPWSTSPANHTFALRMVPYASQSALHAP